MKTLLAVAAIATAALAGPVAAQTYYRTMPAPMSDAPTWMMDDGSSSDYPIHNPGDISGDRLNAQYSGGLTVPPGHGLPGYPGLR